MDIFALEISLLNYTIVEGERTRNKLIIICNISFDCCHFSMKQEKLLSFQRNKNLPSQIISTNVIRVHIDKCMHFGWLFVCAC